MTARQLTLRDNEIEDLRSTHKEAKENLTNALEQVSRLKQDLSTGSFVFGGGRCVAFFLHNSNTNTAQRRISENDLALNERVNEVDILKESNARKTSRCDEMNDKLLQTVEEVDRLTSRLREKRVQVDELKAQVNALNYAKEMTTKCFQCEEWIEKVCMYVSDVLFLR